MKSVILIAFLVAASAVSGFSTGSLTPLFLNGRIVGGENAGIREFPSQVSIQSGTGGQRYHMCGGAIYDATRILTAAHCVKGMNVANLAVLAGKHDLSIQETEEQFSLVASAEFHESFNESTVDFDIGIITLSEPLIFTPFVQPVRLALETIEPSGDAINTGWGSVRDDGVELPNILQKVTLNVIDRDTCVNNYVAINAITENMVCAAETGKGACSGDSGGPLMAKDEANRYYLAGLVSWGTIPCAQDGYPTVFANIAKLRPWLESKLNP